MDIVKIGVLGIAGVLLALILRKEKSEFSILISMVVCICIFVYIITKLQTIFDFTKKLEDMVSIDSAYIGLVVKMVGITYAAEFSSNICKDAGYTAIAGQIETFAKMSILVVSLPVLMTFMETIGSFL